MSEPLTDDELDAMETEQPRAAAQIRELRAEVAEWRNKKLVPCVSVASEAIEQRTADLEADNARLRAEAQRLKRGWVEYDAKIVLLMRKNARLRDALGKLLSDVKLFHGGVESWASVQDADTALKKSAEPAEVS